MEEDDLVQGIFIEVNPDLIVIARDGYTVLDLLSGIGGIQGILISIMCTFLNFWNYNHLENYLALKLFKFDGVETSNSGAAGNAEALPSQWQTLKFFCLDKVIPNKLACCRKEARFTAM